MTDEYVDDAAEATTIEESAAEDTSTQYGVGPFTVRELAILVGWVIAFVVSFFSVSTLRFDSVWTSGLLWILTIGVPTAAVFLIVLRRFSPDGIRRVGSLGVDQFASVAFSVSAVVWLQLLWETIAFAIGTGAWARGWVVWVELALMIALVVLTVFAPFIAPLSDDFAHRPETTAHRNARPVRAVIARPRVERPVAEPIEPDFAPYGAAPTAAAEPQPYAPTGEQAEWAPGYARGGSDTAVQPAYEPPAYEQPVIEPEPVVAAQPVEHAHQAFWALAPIERDVVDDRGIPIFRVGPTAWALVIEDRGEVFVVRHEDGRIGYLHDVTGVTRG